MSFDYANSESAKTRLRKALVYNFSKITEEEGYRNNIGDIYTAYVDRGRIANWPAVCIIPGVERVLNEDMSEDLLHKEIDISGMAYIRETDDPDLAREELLADIETMIGRNFTLQDEAGDESCLVCWMTGCEPFGMVANEPQIGFVFGIKIRYRQLINDASVLA